MTQWPTEIGAYEDRPTECYHCGGLFPRRELGAIDGLPGYRWPRYCRSCVVEIREAHTRHCVLCASTYLEENAGDTDGLCPECRTDEHQRELARVRYHLERARARGLPATLTLGEWLAALEHFGRRCAYCHGPFTDLDHFVPLSAGGGTSAANCVPACSRCNSAKRDLNPNAEALHPLSLVKAREYLRRR